MSESKKDERPSKGGQRTQWCGQSLDPGKGKNTDPPAEPAAGS